jgi:hypothetical protein
MLTLSPAGDAAVAKAVNMQNPPVVKTPEVSSAAQPYRLLRPTTPDGYREPT